MRSALRTQEAMFNCRHSSGGDSGCSYARHVWLLVSNWTQGVIKVPKINEADIEEWWKRSLGAVTAKERRSTAAILMFSAWNIRKERNRRVFEGESLCPYQVFSMIQNVYIITSLFVVKIENI
uniref:Uncharacterized protein n=1 Tax=Setaria viridis TaxID=4556 RepID=A0A4U6VBM2_SETVI|nr:hypothetical protein SEVIR_3G100300v2 [Setaria viridis]